MSAGIEFNANVLNQLGTPAMNSNLFANRPAAGFTGRIFISTDTREIYRDTGTTWELIGSGGGSVNIYNSNGTLTGNRTVNLSGNTLYFEHDSNTNRGLYVKTLNVGNQATASVTIENSLGQGFSIGKAGVNYGTFKILTANNSYIYNASSDLAILNDNATGVIKIAAGGASFAQLTLTNLGRLLFRTTTDSGYDLDINGTSIFRNSVTVNDYIYFNTDNRGISAASNSISINLYGGRAINNAFRWGLLNLQDQNNTNRSFQEFSQVGIAYTGGSNAYTVLNVNPTVNTIGGTSTFYGFRWNPNLISTTGLTHYSIYTDSGIVENYDRSNLTTSNFTDRNIWTLQARLRQTLTAGADQAGAGYYVGGLHIREISASGNNTFGNATINAGGASSLQIDFTGVGTLTASQSGLRAFAGHQIFNTFGGSASGTITHFAGMQILGLYNRNSGVITPTITNAYGLVINNLNDYSHTFTLTNRWGLYQTGASDNNYLAGKLLVGTTTVTARQVHINGDLELTTTLSGTAGSISGQHLNIWLNGNQYKIELRNP